MRKQTKEIIAFLQNLLITGDTNHSIFTWYKFLPLTSKISDASNISVSVSLSHLVLIQPLNLQLQFVLIFLSIKKWSIISLGSYTPSCKINNLLLLTSFHMCASPLSQSIFHIFHFKKLHFLQYKMLWVLCSLFLFFSFLQIKDRSRPLINRSWCW